MSLTFPDLGFGVNERGLWEQHPAWQGWRQLVERALVAWDWAEAFVAMNLVVRPAVEEAVLRGLGQAARHNDDTLLGMLTDAELLDAERHRRWAAALVKMALDVPGNDKVIAGWIAKWEPLADMAIESFCAALPDVPNAAVDAKAATRRFRGALGL